MFGIHIGFDPGTEYVGICPIDSDGNPLPKNLLEGDVAWRAFHANNQPAKAELARKGRTGLVQASVDDRLEILEECIRHYLYNQLPFYFARLNITDWDILSFTIENPASGGVQYYDEGKSRHDAGFALGRAYQMIASQLRHYIHAQGRTTAVYQAKAGQSSMAVNLGPNASKKLRNERCATITGGRFIAQTNYSKSYVSGGSIEGANPDTLDAFAAALVGRDLFIKQQHVKLVKEEQSTRTRRNTPIAR
jgi:hypothetical protein